MAFIVLSCRGKAHDNKKFSHENSKPYRESRIITRLVEPWMLFSDSGGPQYETEQTEAEKVLSTIFSSITELALLIKKFIEKYW